MFHSAFVAHDQPAAVIHPAKAAFDLPARAITRSRYDGAAARRLAPLTTLKGRDGCLNASAAQSLTKVMAAVGVVCHQCLRASPRPAAWLGNTYGRRGGIRQLALMGLGTVHIHAHRQTMTISRHHPGTARRQHEEDTVARLPVTVSLPAWAGFLLMSLNQEVHWERYPGR
jgi:hypothetical protein